MFSQHGLETPRNAVDPLIGEMIELLKLVNSFIEDALGTLVSEALVHDDREVRRLAEKSLAPEFGTVSIPFWTSMPGAKG